MHPEAKLVARVPSRLDPGEKTRICVSLNEELYGDDYWDWKWTSERGRAELGGLPPGRYKIFVRTAERECLGRFYRDIRAGETVELEIDLEDLRRRFAKITGTISGATENVDVYLSRADDPEKTIGSTEWTSRKTLFSFGGIPPGQYILRTSQDASKRAVEWALTLRAGEEVKLDLDL